MTPKLKIIFMGTPDFAVATLAELIAHNYTIAAVITAADKPAGRGRKLNESAVKKYARSQNLPVLQPTNLKDPDFITELKALDADLQIVVAFRMLPQVVWQMPRFGTFNLHASLLPNYRGAAPIHWAIINGETKTGVTTFFIDEKIDTGAIILQKNIDITSDETVGMLHDKLMTMGSELVIDTVKLIESGPVTTNIQDQDSTKKTAYKLHKDNCKIDWGATMDTVYNKIRGLNPFPSAWCYLLNNEETYTVKIFAIEKEVAEHLLSPGQIRCTASQLKVAVVDGFIIVKEIQLPGKRKMDTKSLLNGFNFNKDAKML